MSGMIVHRKSESPVLGMTVKRMGWFEQLRKKSPFMPREYVQPSVEEALKRMVNRRVFMVPWGVIVDHRRRVYIRAEFFCSAVHDGLTRPRGTADLCIAGNKQGEIAIFFNGSPRGYAVKHPECEDILVSHVEIGKGKGEDEF